MPDSPKPTDLVGTSDAAKILGVTSATVTRMVASDQLTPAGRLGDSGAFVFHRADVLTLAEKRATDAKSKPIEVNPATLSSRNQF